MIVNWADMILSGESETLEFKKNTGMLKEAVQTLCAMANRHGGSVIFGVDDQGIPVGQNVADDTLRSISQGVQLNTEPRLYPSIEKININGRVCVAVTIEESPLKPHFAYGRPWIRVGSVTQRMGRDEYEIQILQRNNGYAFDHLPLPGADEDDIDTDTLFDMLERANAIRSLNVNMMSSKWELLNKLGLTVGENQLTRAAILLFGKEPQRFFLGQFETRCGHFSSATEYDANLNDQFFRGNLLNQFGAILDYITQRLQVSTQKTPTGSLAATEIPSKVIREAIVNMLVHRDYRNGIVNTVEIRPESIILRNPGHLFAPQITLEKLFIHHPSKPGNKKIAHVFFLSGLFEQWGSGTTTMTRLMEENGLPRPVFQLEDGIFSVTLARRL